MNKFNNYAIGATAILYAEKEGEILKKMREFSSYQHTTDKYGSKDDRVIFGLGQDLKPLQIEVRWPSGAKTFKDLKSWSFTGINNPIKINEINPSTSPTFNTSTSPSLEPTLEPTLRSTNNPTKINESNPSPIPTLNTSTSPSLKPTLEPTPNSTNNPTKNNEKNPSSMPTLNTGTSPPLEPTLETAAVYAAFDAQFIYNAINAKIQFMLRSNIIETIFRS